MSEHMKFRTARMNMKNDAERRAFEIIQENEESGVSFKQLAVIAILMREGEDLTPYLVPQQQNGLTRDDMARLLQDTLAVQLEHYTDELLRQLKKRGGMAQQGGDSYDDAEVTDVARNFAKGYLQRSKHGDDDE
jgi:hypothetical protein